MTITVCRPDDMAAIREIINAAATAYRGVIPADCWHEPYMTESELQSELAAGVNFWSWQRDGTLAGVMGLKTVRDVALIRHAYVRPSHQGQGIGSALLRELSAHTTAP